MRKFTNQEIDFIKDCLSKEIPKFRFVKSVLKMDMRAFNRNCKELGINYPNFRKRKVNYNPFQNINDPQVQYWLGWLATD